MLRSDLENVPIVTVRKSVTHARRKVLTFRFYKTRSPFIITV